VADEGLVALLDRALHSALGIAVRTSDPERLRAKLYATKRELQNPDYEGLLFKPANDRPHDTIWIIKKNPSPTEPSANG
jgi:hypothetical protein